MIQIWIQYSPYKRGFVTLNKSVINYVPKCMYERKKERKKGFKPKHVVEDNILEVLKIRSFLCRHSFQTSNQITKTFQFVAITLLFRAETHLKKQAMISLRGMTEKGLWLQLNWLTSTIKLKHIIVFNS